MDSFHVESSENDFTTFTTPETDCRLHMSHAERFNHVATSPLRGLKYPEMFFELMFSDVMQSGGHS